MKLVLLFIMMIAFSGCNTTRITYDYDLLIDFSKFDTYAFSERSEQYGKLISGSRFLNAVEKQMSRRGLRKAQNPDVVIDVYVVREQKEKEIVASHDDSSPWIPGYSTGFKVRSVSIDDYTEGTIFINMVHEQQKKIIWQVRTTKLQIHRSSKANSKHINKVVAKMFETYPFRTNNY